ncbi:hypothetical protein FOZ60_007163 [Perkinsus olseni]|uniref:Uncharacterized protein n=1 Tax=Perkinsus olseni TaxID=32597 RepID=A0A7J6R1J9_PEROL|nr:hypothetical protein FOZ60_007163 [Perkinsus olseni]KAF4714433.1 hypothetical protein FOZ62_022402 [Perkinsus olseni]
MRPSAHSRLLYYANRSESLCEEPPDAGPAAQPGDLLQLMLLRFDRATLRILKEASVDKARHAMQRSTFPSLLPLFDSIRRALACHKRSSDTLERYRDMLVGIRQADEYIMRARVNDVPVEVLQLIRVWREYCCHRFAWGLTSTEEMGWLQTKLMRLMQRCGHTLTVLDPLAATGWHAYLMDVVGSTVSFQVSDSCPAPGHLQWASCPVLRREALEAVRATPTADVLWLSWPPHEPDDLAFNLLSAFPGRVLVYIGEWPSASTTSVSLGARMFFEAIQSGWVEIARRKAEVNWPGYNQELVLLEKRRTTFLPRRHEGTSRT